jgi:hypothetical protein
MLLDMCRILFPEYKSIYIDENSEFLQFSEDAKSAKLIHWFEFCLIKIFPKVYNVLNAEHLSNFYYVTFGYSEKSNQNKSWDYPRFIHPVDYLYQRFLKQQNEQ